MPDRILHRTWSIRTISSFARPLILGGVPSVSASAANCSSTGASRARRNHYPSLTELADDLTDRMRGCPDLVGAVAAAASSAAGGAGGDDTVDVGGTYATLAWIVLEDDDAGNDQSDNAVGSNHGDEAISGSSGGGGRKRPRSTSTKQQQQQQQRHLHIDLMVNDELAGQMLLCSAQITDDTSQHGQQETIQSFSYLLVRGQLRSYRPILLYLESTFGCTVGTRPFTPSPADVARSLTSWMVVDLEKRRRLNNGGGSGNNRSSSGGGIGINNRPLELTLAIPQHLAKAGLERITLTVPPVSLARLCSAVERNRPSAGGGGDSAGAGGLAARGGGGRITPLMVTDSEKEDESSSSCFRASAAAPKTSASTAAAAADEDAGSDNAEKMGESNVNPQQQQQQHPEQYGEELPILRALQCYLYEAFHIDARHLHVIKAATAHAVVGTDGRIKPLTVEALPSLLEDVGGMVKKGGGLGVLGGE